MVDKIRSRKGGSGTGNAFAGGAAAADDASVVWSNPAAMTALPMGFHAAGALPLAIGGNHVGDVLYFPLARTVMGGRSASGKSPRKANTKP